MFKFKKHLDQSDTMYLNRKPDGKYDSVHNGNHGRCRVEGNLVVEKFPPRLKTLNRAILIKHLRSRRGGAPTKNFTEE